MPYQWIEHTAELELRIHAPTREAVFSEAMHALIELIGDGPVGAARMCDVEIAGPDLAALLVRWLDELVYRAETEDLIPEAIEQIELGDGGLQATVRGHRGEPRHLVKGATYHQLSFERQGSGFSATVVLDV